MLCWIDGAARKLVVRDTRGTPPLLEEVPDLIVGAHVGAPEPIDGLLGISDDEEVSPVWA